MASDCNLPLDGTAQCVLRQPAVAALASISPTLDRAAVERLIAKQYTGLRLLIQRRTGDPDVAADILNQAACTSWEKWQAGQLRRPEEIGGYIFQVAMNLLRNRRRSVAERSDRRVDPDVLGVLPADADTADRWLEKQLAARVKRILQDLNSPRDREILVRFYLQEEDKNEIRSEEHTSELQSPI